MGIDSPQTYIKTRYKDRTGDLMMLKSCCIGQSVMSEIEANVEDTVVSQSQWIDIMVCFICQSVAALRFFIFPFVSLYSHLPVLMKMESYSFSGCTAIKNVF